MSTRFSVLASIGLACVLSAHECRAVQPGNWDQFGGPRRDFSVDAAGSNISQSKVADPILGKDWTVPLGVGASGAVVSGPHVFTMYCVPDDTAGDWKDNGTECIAAFSLANGEKIWEQSWPVTAHKDQEGYDKVVVRPLATPCVADGVVFTLGFTGILAAWSQQDGHALWRHDLVTEFEATPVQYGFSASPLMHDGRLYVHVGGKQAAVICFEPSTGEVIWKSEPDEPSYASPLIHQIDERKVIVQLTGNALMLLDPKTGDTLLKYSLSKPGLTNVPTPICLPDDHILIACQGNNGASLLKVSQVTADGKSPASSFSATEVWENNKLSYFYCNWASDGKVIAGFQGKTMTLFDWKTGKIISQQRNFSDSNLLRMSDAWLVLRGDGLLCRCQHNDSGLTTMNRLQVTTDRCWTPPTVVDASTILVRTEKSLMRVSLSNLSVDAEAATDLEFTSMDAMYGGQPKVVELLIADIESADEAACLERFRNLQKSAPLAINSTTLRKLFAAANERKHGALSAEIITAWKTLDEKSLLLPEAEFAMLESAGRNSEAEQIRRTRLVKTLVRVAVPDDTAADSVITIAGNRPALGEWQPDRVVLQRTKNGLYEKELWMVPGSVQLKVTRGNWETVETQKDGSELKNRRFEIAEGKILDIKVERWLK